MRPIKILVDSTCDLPKEYLDKHDVTVLPLLVVFGNDAYRDGVDINVEQLYNKVEELKTLPKTSALPSAQFEKEFKKWVDAGYDVLCIVISSGFSSTLQNAYIAAQQFDGHVVAFDSQNLSSGIGLLICKAVEMKEAGLPLNEIVVLPTSFVLKVSLISFLLPVIDTLPVISIPAILFPLALISKGAKDDWDTNSNLDLS